MVDHIISGKHGGVSEVDNLAYACLRFNAWNPPVKLRSGAGLDAPVRRGRSHQNGLW